MLNVKSRRALLRTSALVGTLCVTLIAGQAFGQDATYTFDIPSETLAQALHDLAKVSGQQIIFTPDQVAGKAAPALRGSYTVDQALARLFSGTDLTVDHSSNAGLMVRSKNAKAAQNEGATFTPQAAETVVVVGSRLLESVNDSPVPTQLYDRAEIDRSGSSSVSQFLNTLPQVSVQTTTTGGTQQFAGAQTVQIHGLPAGTALVLINGRRVESSTGSQSATNFFDLNQIPLAAVDRVEVLPTGSSAIYGGDALGGVVNVVLKQNYNGISGSVRYGGTSDGAYNETEYSLSAGWTGSNWSISAIGLYSNNSELSGNERSITANSNYTAQGGLDNRAPYSNPGNVYSTTGMNLPGLNAKSAGIPLGSSGVGLTPSSFAATAGVPNLASLTSYVSYLAPAERYGTFVSGTYDITPSIQLFAELLYSHNNQTNYINPPLGVAINVPAGNVYNPFGQAVTVRYLYTGLGRGGQTSADEFFRPLVGARGSFLDKWTWEVAGWSSQDWDDIHFIHNVANTPAITAALANGSFNPFQDGPGASQSVLDTFYRGTNPTYSGTSDLVNGFVRGPLLNLDSGTVEVVFGGEYERDKLKANDTLSSTVYSLGREIRSGFAEFKVPIIGDHSSPEASDILSAQLALRYDSYSDGGDRFSPSAAMSFRPTQSLLLRASWSSAYKPPSLYQLSQSTSTVQTTVVDPERGNQTEAISQTFGGNPNLHPQTGWTRNIGFVYTPEFLDGLTLSVTNWMIHTENGILGPTLQQVVSFPDAFPGRVVRSPVQAGDPYSVGPITSANLTTANFSYIHEAGFDIGAQWRVDTDIGEFSPSVALTRTYKYLYEVDPTLGPQNAASQANDNGNYAPHWKGVAGLNWKLDPFSVNVDGRYTGAYKDVTDLTPTPRTLGNFWYADLNIRYEFGKETLPVSGLISQAYISGGVRNLFNKLPPYSDINFGGYDANEYDIEGRLLYVQLGVKY